MTTIHFEAGDFGADVILEGLPYLPVNNTRKLLRLMFSEPWNNHEAIEAMASWLPEAVRDAKAEWHAESLLFADKWRDVNKHSRKKEIVEQRKLNRQLERAVKNAKADYEAVSKLQSIFEEQKEK